MISCECKHISLKEEQFVMLEYLTCHWYREWIASYRWIALSSLSFIRCEKYLTVRYLTTKKNIGYIHISLLNRVFYSNTNFFFNTHLSLEIACKKLNQCFFLLRLLRLKQKLSLKAVSFNFDSKKIGSHVSWREEEGGEGWSERILFH